MITEKRVNTNGSCREFYTAFCTSFCLNKLMFCRIFTNWDGIFWSPTVTRNSPLFDFMLLTFTQYNGLLRSSGQCFWLNTNAWVTGEGLLGLSLLQGVKSGASPSLPSCGSQNQLLGVNRAVEITGSKMLLNFIDRRWGQSVAVFLTCKWNSRYF